MQTKHIYLAAVILGGLAGFFLLTGANTYGAGQWGASSFGLAYNAGNKLAL